MAFCKLKIAPIVRVLLSAGAAEVAGAGAAVVVTGAAEDATGALEVAGAGAGAAVVDALEQPSIMRLAMINIHTINQTEVNSFLFFIVPSLLFF